VKYKDSSWATLLENRLRLTKDWLNEKGSIFVRCDYNGNWIVRPLMNEIFGKDNFRNEIIVNRTQEFFKFAQGLNKFMVDIDTLLFFVKSDMALFNEIKIKRDVEKWWEPTLPGQPKSEEDKYRIILGEMIESPRGRKWGLSQEQIKDLENEGRIRIESGKVKYAPLWTILKNNWTDIPGYSRGWGFLTENSEVLLKRVIESASNEGDLVMDFFLGSGTTTAVAHKLGRKWIGVEMGEHFYSVILPRMKKVLAYDKSGISKEVKEYKGGGFFKYSELEQYEDSLENIANDLKPDELLLYTEIDDYLIKYMIDWESNDSNIFLNPDNLQDPFNYKLYITKDYKQQLVNIDLIETFNYLFGLHVKKYYKKVYDDIQYVAVLGEKEGKTYVIIWRPTKNINVEKDKENINVEKDKENINDILKNINIDVDEIYVNTDAILDRSFNVIDSLFKNLMLNN